MQDLDETRVAWAEAFLQEAVFRSRGAQAGAGLWAKQDPSAADCGLGSKAVVALDLTPKAAELFRELWPLDPDQATLSHIQKTTTVWVERQDALDRDRNHFLKAFRTKHGFDRSSYDEAQAAAYRSGLDEINSRVCAERRSSAQRLIQTEASNPS